MDGLHEEQRQTCLHGKTTCCTSLVRHTEQVTSFFSCSFSHNSLAFSCKSLFFSFRSSRKQIDARNSPLLILSCSLRKRIEARNSSLLIFLSCFRSDLVAFQSNLVLGGVGAAMGEHVCAGAGAGVVGRTEGGARAPALVLSPPTLLPLGVGKVETLSLVRSMVSTMLGRSLINLMMLLPFSSNGFVLVLAAAGLVCRVVILNGIALFSEAASDSGSDTKSADMNLLAQNPPSAEGI